MAAGYQNLYLEQGTTFNVTVTIDDVYGNVYDLNNTNVVSQIRKSYYSANATASFVTSVNSSTGSITLSLDSKSSANIAAGRYVYDTKISFPGVANTAPTVIRVLEGVVDVSPNVTR